MFLGFHARIAWIEQKGIGKMNDEWRTRLDEMAVKSKRQCEICALMPGNVCLKWEYKREYVQGTIEHLGVSFLQ